MPKFLISAAHKSSGKTTLSIGLCAALSNANTQVQAFKKGPDYIDPMWLSMACQRPCYNLDFHTMSANEITQLVVTKSHDADWLIVEGNKGLYDGLDLDGSNSNAALAKHLGLPVVLVLDARGMTRGIAPLVLGYQQFDADINIRGVILNQVGGSRHESKLRQILEHYTDVKVIGAVHRDPKLSIDERHLGLVPSNEREQAMQHIRYIADQIKTQVNLDDLTTLATPESDTPATSEPLAPAPINDAKSETVRIGIIQDSAFGFYYPDDLEALENAGAQLVPINSLDDQSLPAVDGLFIGGGFPETHLNQLTANESLRNAIKSALEQGLPCYAECGGLMYLARQIQWQEQQAEMVGFIPGDITMHARPKGRGYVKLAVTDAAPWPVTDGSTDQVNAHEFHYSSLSLDPGEYPFAFKVLRGSGIQDQLDGLILKNTLASYAHLRSTGQCHWAPHFVEFIRQFQLKQQRNAV